MINLVKFPLRFLRSFFEFSREKCLAVEETAVVDLAASAATDVEGKSPTSPFKSLHATTLNRSCFDDWFLGDVYEILRDFSRIKNNNNSFELHVLCF